MFYEDNGFREMFIYGSVAMLAALAFPSKKAQAAEFYLCGDGRTIELTNANRPTASRQDSCVTSWYTERHKAANTKAGNPNDAVANISQSSGYQIQTAAIEPLVNAIEVPEGRPMPASSALREKPMLREKSAGDLRGRREPGRKSVAMSRSPKGLRHIGDGIYTE